MIDWSNLAQSIRNPVYLLTISEVFFFYFFFSLSVRKTVVKLSLDQHVILMRYSGSLSLLECPSTFSAFQCRWLRFHILAMRLQLLSFDLKDSHHDHDACKCLCWCVCLRECMFCGILSLCLRACFFNINHFYVIKK